MEQIQSLSKQASKQARKQVEVIGSLDSMFESTNRIYSVDGVAPTVCTYCGGNQEPKILEVKKLDVNELGFIEHGTGKHQSNTVFGTDGVSGEVHHGFNEFRTAEPREDGVSNTITTVLKDNMILEQCIVAMRGRNPENPSDRTPGIDLEQRLEVNSEGICNTLTSVQKDNLVLEVRKEIDPKYHNFIYDINGELYLIRIRKLIPRECWRLMSFTDEDFEKAASVNSNTQLYKQVGNSIVVKVLECIFKRLIKEV